MKKEYSFPHFSHYGLYAEVGKFFELKGGLWASIKICPESNSDPLARHSMVHTQPSSTCSLDSQKPPNFFLFLPLPVYSLVSRGTLLTGDQIPSAHIFQLFLTLRVEAVSLLRASQDVHDQTLISVCPGLSPPFFTHSFHHTGHLSEVHFMAFALALPSAWNSSFRSACLDFSLTSSCDAFGYLCRILPGFGKWNWETERSC